MVVFYVLLALLVPPVTSDSFPCGSSFTPCQEKARGAKTRKGDLRFVDDKDVLFNVDQEKAEILRVETSKMISADRLKGFAREAVDVTDNLFNKTEKDLVRALSESSFTASELAWNRYLKADQYSKYLSYSALASLRATEKAFSEVKKLEEVEKLPFVGVFGTALQDICPVNRIINCEPAKYRIHSGHCNNVNRPMQGAVYESMHRLLLPQYEDKISSPRGSSESPLPSALDVASLFTPAPTGHATCSLLLGQWASFLYEDLAQVAANRLVEGSYFSSSKSLPLPCCKAEGESHPECFPILSNSSGKDVCLSYARSLPTPRENCTLGIREQGNMVSSYLDGSQIYGSSTETANNLRLFKDGLLKLQSKDLPLPAEDSTDCRGRGACFQAGSHRVNFLPTNAAIYTIWMRQHNLVANKLKKVNDHWSDEKLYQEARRIVIAQMQHITYSEFLPLVIGKENVKRYGVDLKTHGYDSRYDITRDGSVLNEFAAAAGQFFLTLLPSSIVPLNTDKRPIGSHISLDKLYHIPSLVTQRGRLDGLLRFLLYSPIEKPGLHISPSFRKMFASGSSPGVDMAAMLVQMGRDHGIPGYLQWRNHCRLENVQAFASLAQIWKPSVNMSEVEALYGSPEDIDLLVGGLAEIPTEGALLGPTLACLFAQQMRNTKRGDRFWYENFVAPSAFTDGQLTEIRRTSMARVLCDNGDTLKKIQGNVFLLPDEFGNCPVSCSSTLIDGPDFGPWADPETDRTPQITKETLEKAIRLGIELYNRQQESEGRNIARNGASSSGPSAVRAHASLMAPKRQSQNIARTASVLREATKILVSGEGLLDADKLPLDLDVASLQKLLPQINVGAVIGNFTPYLGFDPLPKEQCLPQPLPCDHTFKYRTSSGWCNNLKFPTFGNAFTQMRRLIDPAYDDGFDSPRTRAKSGKELPSARLVSNLVHTNAPKFHVKYSHMLMQFGQILDHDMMHSPIARGPNNSILNCSRCDSADTLSVYCFPIKIPKDDLTFPEKHDDGSPRCMPFARSLVGQLTLGYRNQLNQLTAFLDASPIYGSTECEASALRLFSGGKLNFTDMSFSKENLPQGRQERDCRSHLSNPEHKCFVAGDERVNEQPGLTVIHTILLREHNRIASQLQRINNFWTDEILYQETRRIMIAQIQHIIFSEFLPVVLGCESMEKYDLMPRKSGYFTGYNDSCDPSISQEMSTAAFRFGHSLIRGVFPRMNDAFVNTSTPLSLKDHFSNPGSLYDQKSGHLESVLMGLLGAESMSMDRHITDAVRNHLFAKPGGPLTGIDLPAVNIQRARDHGVPAYNNYREFCGLRRARTFYDLRSEMDADAVEALQKTYKDVDDIDIFPGIMSERPKKGALVGPTLICLIGEQMQRLKTCDRFYYETDSSMVRFTPDQLAELRKTTLSRLICENSQYAERIQPNAFLLPDELSNAPMNCAQLPSVDLYKWLDRKFCVIDRRIVNRGRTKRITPCVTCTCTIEGPECHTLSMQSCDSLLQDYSPQEIAKDPVCVIQCPQFGKYYKSTKRF